MSGALLENYAVLEIVKSYQNVGLEPYIATVTAMPR